MNFPSLYVEQVIAEINACPIHKKYLDLHHTSIPSYKDFNGRNHQHLNNIMRDYHLSQDYSDIAQHYTLFPDSLFLAGRDLRQIPASVKHHNADGVVMIEMLGNFGSDDGRIPDLITESMVAAIHAIITQCNLQLRFHRDFYPDGDNPTCPGTTISKELFLNYKPQPQPTTQTKEAAKIMSTNTNEGTTQHYALAPYNELNANGITIHEQRFDDKITRGEVIALLYQMLLHTQKRVK